jgi:hypothetical protein
VCRPHSGRCLKFACHTSSLPPQASRGAQGTGLTTRLLTDSADIGAAAAMLGGAAAPAPAGEEAAAPAAYDDLGFTAHLLADATGASAFVPRGRATGSFGAAGAAPLGATAALSPAPSAAAAAHRASSLHAAVAALPATSAGAAPSGSHLLLSAGGRRSMSLLAPDAPGSVGTAGRRSLGLAALSEDRGATLPFSGALGHALSGMTPGGGHGTTSRAAQPITFQDFLQVVDMQFLDHIRRGTSINMMDLAPGPVPNDLAEALKVGPTAARAAARRRAPVRGSRLAAPVPGLLPRLAPRPAPRPDPSTTLPPLTYTLGAVPDRPRGGRAGRRAD